MKQPMRISVLAHFDAAHCLTGYQGDCANLHGHRWEVRATFEKATGLDSVGISVDFKELKRRINEVLPDHRLLNDIPELRGSIATPSTNPTAENLLPVLWQRIAIAVEGVCSLVHLELWESPGCSVSCGAPC